VRQGGSGVKISVVQAQETDDAGSLIGVVTSAGTAAGGHLPPRYVDQVSALAAGAILQRLAPDQTQLADLMSQRMKAALERPEIIGPSDLDRLPSGVLPSQCGFRLPLSEVQAEAGPREFTLVDLNVSKNDDQGGRTEAPAVVRARLARAARMRSLLARQSNARVRERPSASRVTAAVMCQSAASIAAALGIRFVDAAALLAYARRRTWQDRYDGTPNSAVAGLRDARALRTVVFLDPELGLGQWIEVDRSLEAPAAALLMKFDLTAGLPGRFSFISYQATASAQAAKSRTRS
jgi:hypothetical protein